MMVYYFPDLVRMDLIPDDPAIDFPPYDIYPTRVGATLGVLSSARGATPAKGELMGKEVSQLIAQTVRKEFER
jgi:creatinine amidohydrolase